MPYRVSTIQCPNCKSNCEGVYEFDLIGNKRRKMKEGIKELVGVNCFVCGFKKKIDNKIVAGEKSFQEKLI